MPCRLRRSWVGKTIFEHPLHPPHDSKSALSSPSLPLHLHSHNRNWLLLTFLVTAAAEPVHVAHLTSHVETARQLDAVGWWHPERKISFMDSGSTVYSTSSFNSAVTGSEHSGHTNESRDGMITLELNFILPCPALQVGAAPEAAGDDVAGCESTRKRVVFACDFISGD